MPSPVMTDDLAADASVRLRAADPVLAPIIGLAGLCPVRPHTDYYAELVRRIIGQQLSVRAALAIRAKFTALFGGRFPTPEELLGTPEEALRSAGLSRAKIAYLTDLSRHVLDEATTFDRFEHLENDEIASQLTAVKGIGEWTAQMFLMFCMGRTDILPVTDLGIRNGMRTFYGLDSLPDRAAMLEIAARHHWHPYESVASWYLWKGLDIMPEIA